MSSSVPFAPPDIGEAEVAAVAEVLRSGWLTTGKKANAFESAIVDRTGCGAALASNSCTAALHLAMVVHGIGAGDEVIVPAMTFCSTAHVIVHCGATPVLVDCEADTLNLAPSAVEAAITARTRAICIVHYAGHPADMDVLQRLADEHNLLVIEDAAHAIGGRWRDVPIGGTGNPTAFSFYATKNLVTGEGGMLCGDQDLIDRARVLSLHGMDRDAWKRYDRGGRWRYDVTEPGYKYNCSDLQAALGLAQLERFDAMQKRRREVAERYHELLVDCLSLQLPIERSNVRHAWHLYVIQLNLEELTITRDCFIDELSSSGIGCSVHFIPLHHHRWMRERHPVDPRLLPYTERAFERIVSLPMNSVISDQQINQVAMAVRSIVSRHRR